MKKNDIIKLLEGMDMIVEEEADNSVYYEFNECYGYIKFDENDDFIKVESL